MRCLDREQQTLLLDGRLYGHAELMELLHRSAWNEEDAEAPLWDFLKEWFDDSPLLTVHTSGSTGKPKYLQVRKEQMMNSARITCDFLELDAGDTALLCMSLNYIAGKMVVVRALVAGLDLVYRLPSGHPMIDVNGPVCFAAMVPLQVYNSLQVEEERARLALVDTLIIGGGVVDEALQQALQSLPGKVYSTYGMTETLSHIALRKLNGADASRQYYPFDSVRLSLSEEGTLMIDAPLVCDETLVTNDVARLNADGSFVILGRKDNIVNSGGIKLQLEELEEKLKELFQVPYALTSVKDCRLGEALVLLIENSENTPEAPLKQQLLEVLGDRYKCPKHILYVSELPMTGSGKIDRAGCRKVAASLIS